jgi:RimJ/RimL family protein N-acetyltransferase
VDPTVAHDSKRCFDGTMPALQTSRLKLQTIAMAEAERIVARTEGALDSWADDYPFEGDVAAVTGFIRATARYGDQSPFGYYQISRLTDGRAIGGVGFKGQPHRGCVEIGFGMVPSARGHGYAAEAVLALLGLAADFGLSRVIADSAHDDIASHRTLLRAGFHLVSTDKDLRSFEVLLNIDRD